MNLATWAAVAGALVALYCLIIFAPAYLDNLSVKEAAVAAASRGINASDDLIQGVIINRVNFGQDAVGYHYEEDPETGARTEIRGLGLEPENITVFRNEPARTLTITVAYSRVIRLFPTQRYTTLRFHIEKEVQAP